MRRFFWMGIGAAAGVGGTVWAQWRVRQEIRRLGVDGVAASTAATVGRAAATLRAAAAAGREELARKEAELWAGIERPRPARRPSGGGTRASGRPVSGAHLRPVPQGGLRGGRHDHR